MRCNRLILAAIATAALASVCFAEPATGPTFSAGEVLYGRFSQTRKLKDLAQPLKSDGTFVLAPGKGLIWRLEHPVQMTTVISPAGIRQIVGDNEVQRIDTAKVPVIAHFYYAMNGALLGEWSTLKKDFTINSTGDKHAWRIVLTPLRSTDPLVAAFASIVITGGRMVDGVYITRVNGDSEEIRFFDQTTSSLAAHPDVVKLLEDGNLQPAN